MGFDKKSFIPASMAAFLDSEKASAVSATTGVGSRFC